MCVCVMGMKSTHLVFLIGEFEIIPDMTTPFFEALATSRIWMEWRFFVMSQNKSWKWILPWRWARQQLMFGWDLYLIII